MPLDRRDGMARWGSALGSVTAMLLGLALLAGGPARAAGAPVLRVGWTVPAEEAKWLIMRRPELFPAYGAAYRIAWYQFHGTPPMSQALIAQTLDCATQAPITFGRAVSEGGLDGYILGSLAQERRG